MARNGDIHQAKDVAIEPAGYVTWEIPELQLLLGKLVVQLQNKALLREASHFLQFLGDQSFIQELKQAQNS